MFAIKDDIFSEKVIMQFKYVWIGIVVTVFFCSCALQDDIYTLDHRISALERKNAELEKKNRELEKTNQEVSNQLEGLNQTRRDDGFELRGRYAGLAAQMEIDRNAIQQHTGQLEEMDYLVNRKLKGFEENQLSNRQRMDRLATDMASIEKRIGVVEQYLNMDTAGSKKTGKQVAVAPPGKKKSSDQSLYISSKKAYDAGNYEEARKGFQQLVESYPKSDHADNSQFWIGETYYNEKWYEKAILEYQKVIENYPSGNKVAAALLKQGLAFLQIGETNNARLLLKDLVAKYPGTSEAKVAQKKLESL